MEEKKYKSPNICELKKKIIERDGSYCSCCGRELDINSCTLEHIIPIAYGGASAEENCIILCRECNAKSARIKGYQFESYIKELIEKHPMYHNIHSNVPLKGTKVNVDIICEKNTNNGYEKYIIEVKSIPSFTRDRIFDVINYLTMCKEEFVDAKAVLAFPGEMSEQYHNLLREHDIIVWDKNYMYP